MRCPECRDELFVDEDVSWPEFFWNVLLIPPLIIATGIVTIVWWVVRPVQAMLRRT